MKSQRARPFLVSQQEYPFKDHWFERNGASMHYLDEGKGMPVLMLHGNPTWSFLYRNIIKGLRKKCRCIAPDYPGFGFSDHPARYGYTPQEHAEWVEALIDRLKLRKFILVLQDWGGPIGMSIAVGRPKNVAGLVILNTWCWRPDIRKKIFSVLMGGPLGKYLQLRRNFFASKILPAGINLPTRKVPQILMAYTDPFQTPESRMGTYVFPREIRRSADWLASIEDRLHVLREKPVEMVWAMDDPAFGRESEIRRWQRHFPGARVDRLLTANHYIQEDSPERVTAAIRRLLERV